MSGSALKDAVKTAGNKLDKSRSSAEDASKAKNVKKEGKKDEKVEITSLDNCPDELKPFAKQLLADYTRKTQDVAKTRNQALAFQDLMKDPDFRVFAKDKFGLNTGDPSLEKSDKADNGKSKLDIDLNDEMVDGNIKKMAKYIESLETKIKGFEKKIARQDNDKMISELSTDFPDIEEKIPELLSLLNKGYSLKSAYLEKFGDEIVQRKLEAEMEKAKEDASKDEEGNISPNISGVTPDKVKINAEKKPVTIRTAVENAMEEISEQ